MTREDEGREDEGSGDLLDTNLRDEIELVSDLVIAASGSQRHFTHDEVDALLGVVHTDPAGPGAETLGEAVTDTDEEAHG